MVTRDPGSVLITGPTGGLGRHATLAMARRPAPARPDLILVGRSGERLSRVAAEARAAGATVHEVGCELGDLADVRAAGATAQQLLADGEARPLHGLVANAGITVRDTRGTSVDGYERTFAINHLAHAQLIGALLPMLAAPARIVLLGSNTYFANRFRKLLGVAAADWRDPIDLARPAPADAPASLKTSGTAYCPGGTYPSRQNSLASAYVITYALGGGGRHDCRECNVGPFEPVPTDRPSERGVSTADHHRAAWQCSIDRRGRLAGDPGDPVPGVGSGICRVDPSGAG